MDIRDGVYGFPCARGFDSGIEGQQVGLIRYVGDDDHNIVDGLRVGVELFHIFFQGCADLIYILDAVHHFFYDMGAGFGLFLGFRRRLGGRRGVGGNFADGSVHLTDGGRGIAQAGGGFLGGLIRLADPFRQLRRRRRHDFAHGGQTIGNTSRTASRNTGGCSHFQELSP